MKEILQLILGHISSAGQWSDSEIPDGPRSFLPFTQGNSQDVMRYGFSYSSDYLQSKYTSNLCAE